MSEERIVTCAYCGHEYHNGTPTSQHSGVINRFNVCDKHPVRELNSVNKVLRSALVGLVGSDDKAVLKQMVIGLRSVGIPSEDEICAINGILALINTRDSMHLK